MKSFICTTVVLVLGLASAQCWEATKPASSRKVSPFATACVEGVTCTADCLGLKVCSGGQEYVVNCRQQTGSKPYCNTDTKTCDSDSEHCIVDGEHVCLLGAGYFPDVNDCRKYYQCDKDGFRINYVCDGSAIYHPALHDCEFGLPCYDFQQTGLCRGQTGKLVVHPLNKRMYAFCQGTQQAPILQQCPYENDNFIPSDGTCEFVCQNAGRFKDDRDATNMWYFECITYGNSFVQSHKVCQVDTTFDPKTKACIHKTATTQ